MIDELAVPVGIAALAAAEVRRSDGTEPLSAIEVSLLRFMAAHPDQLVLRSELLEKVWGWRPGLVTRAVDASVLRLRRKIERDPEHPEMLITVHGRGYRFVPLGGPRPSAPLPSTLVGRTREIAWIEGRRAGAVVLHGPGGVGKSTLAREIAARAEATRPGSTRFVDASHAVSEGALLATIAQALDLVADDTPETAIRAIRTAASSLGVIVLDRADQAMAATAKVLGALAAPPSGCLYLVTSRTVIPVGEALAIAPLAPDDAAALFRKRAPRHESDPQVVALVEALGRLPLAIELAAGQAEAFSPAALLSRINQRFDLLRGRGETPGLLATVAWSWETLDDLQRRALARLCALAGPFDLDTAEAMLPEPDRMAATLIEELVRASLLASLGDRWVPYDNVRAFVQRTAPSADAAQLRRAWLARRAAEIPRAGRVMWARDHRPDLQAVLAERAIDPASAAAAAAALLPIVASLPLEERTEVLDGGLLAAVDAGDRQAQVALLVERAAALRFRGDRARAKADLDRACEIAGDHPKLRATALQAMARFVAAAGPSDEAVHALEAALAACRAVPDPAGEAAVAVGLGAVLRRRGLLAEARDMLLRAVVQARASGDRGVHGTALLNLGVLRTTQGATRDARALLNEARVELAAGDRRNLAICVAALGTTWLLDDELGKALEHYDEALALHRAVGSRYGEGFVLGNRAAVHAALGADSAAEADLLQAVAIHRESGDRVAEAFCLDMLGQARLADGRVAAALDTLAEAVGVAGAIGGLVEAPARSSLACALVIAGRIDEADAELRIAWERAPAERTSPERRLVAMTQALVLLGRGRPWHEVRARLAVEAEADSVDDIERDAKLRPRMRLLKRYLAATGQRW